MNPHVMTVREFGGKVVKNDHFVSNIMGSEKIFLIGEEDELKRLGKK